MSWILGGFSKKGDFNKIRIPFSPGIKHEKRNQVIYGAGQSLISFTSTNNFFHIISGSGLSEDLKLLDMHDWEHIVNSDEDLSNLNGHFVVINEVQDGFQIINDSIFKIRVISKFVKDSKLKMKFIFPGFIISKEFDAIDSEDYSLRNIIKNNRSKIEPGEYFYIFAYLLPYEKGGNKYWCKVENSNAEVENWGVKFGIKHYLIFEMKFE